MKKLSLLLLLLFTATFLFSQNLSMTFNTMAISPKAPGIGICANYKVDIIFDKNPNIIALNFDGMQVEYNVERDWQRVKLFQREGKMTKEIKTTKEDTQKILKYVFYSLDKSIFAMSKDKSFTGKDVTLLTNFHDHPELAGFKLGSNYDGENFIFKSFEGVPGMVSFRKNNKNLITEISFFSREKMTLSERNSFIEKVKRHYNLGDFYSISKSDFLVVSMKNGISYYVSDVNNSHIINLMIIDKKNSNSM